MLDISKFLNKYTDKNIILALSWGPDSIFLFDLIKKSEYKDKLIACHFNHSLRKEADNDEDFIKKLCKKNWIKFESKKEDINKIMSENSSSSMEEIARNRRYKFLRECKEKYNADFIILGHHLDDRIETFFLNLSRWSKLTGLINMTESSADLLRPLLNIKKSEILEYLKNHKIDYLFDISNNDNSIKRNLLRNKTLPYLEEINSSYRENILNTLSYFEELKNDIDEKVKLVVKKDYFKISEFNLYKLFIQKEIIRYVFRLCNWKSTIWLSEKNILEIIRFINWKNNKTKKEIKKMSLFKDGDKIYFNK